MKEITKEIIRAATLLGLAPVEVAVCARVGVEGVKVMAAGGDEVRFLTNALSAAGVTGIGTRLAMELVPEVVEEVEQTVKRFDLEKIVPEIK